MVVSAAPTRETAQEVINGKLYREVDLVQTYAHTRLHPSEATALVRYRDDIHGQRVLDLGCGAGRLATYLRPLVEKYVGLDVSAHMVKYCQQAFPTLDFVQGDMRSLTPFDDGAFDTVFAVANLFDAVTHEERRRVLAEVRRVLAPGGLLIFSAHNRNYAHAGTGPKLKFSRNPISQLRLLMEYWRASANHQRIKAFHRFEPEYALLNDSGNCYHTLHYYIERDVQTRQLVSAGFEPIECLGDWGETLGANSRDDAYPSILYVARRDY
ncbi:MAG: hypothetical protein JWN70_3607 [Planctomycetaceae bacterium]|nr:hypothetical protein [Planctomycetaceae bacterium]